ncbi:DUF4145 domain-containing protein [Paenibacillus odorifer]|uniref:DUF4145 domain-containing protein n=1 Tax=Paenibacillus odorifer TaxID=189426 RepID=UPI00096E832A|nr:DUF4145 domain-containing protein [Paenibacillus odorifer]OMD61043.1 hypothetical protein BSK55_06805 [Paenibacillus odorifer]
MSFFSRMFKKPSEVGDRGEELPVSNDGLPDSNNPSGLCPRCNKQSSFEIIGNLPVTFGGGYLLSPNGNSTPLIIDRVSVLICRHCNQGTVVIEEEWVGDIPKSKGMGSGVVSHRGFNWWPLPDTKLSTDVPPDVADAFSEAARVLSANCPRSAVVMLRRTLEAITADKGQTTGTLAQRLKILSDNGIIHPSLQEWIKEIRLIGNMGAHFDPLNEVQMEDAKQLQAFVRELLKYIYELPAELNRRRSGSSAP